jgi:hypothetical protein
MSKAKQHEGERRRSLIEMIEELVGNLNPGEWEEQVYAFACEQALSAAKVLLEKLDKDLMGKRREGLEVVGFRERWVITRVGQFRLRRRLYRDERGKGRYLLDEAMGLEKRSPLSRGVRDLSALLASYMPFGKCEVLLRRLLPSGVSHSTVHREVGRIVDPEIALEEKEAVEVYEEGKAVEKGERKVRCLFIEGDGVNIALQREKARRAELKVGIAYEGWEKVGDQERYRLKEKTAYLGLEDGESFWEGFSLELAHKYDLASIEHVVVGGDGAAWVKEGASILGGLYQLDRFHLRRELVRCLKGDMETVNRVYQACTVGDARAADAILSARQSQSDQDTSQEIERTRAYILDNAAGLADYRLRLTDTDTSGLRGLGAMEGNVDKLAANRMKKRGMSWTRRGIRRMACLIRMQQAGKVCSWSATRTDETPPSSKATIPMTITRRNPKLGHYATYLNMKIPALTGPHSHRPWAKALRKLSYEGIPL